MSEVPFDVKNQDVTPRPPSLAMARPLSVIEAPFFTPAPPEKSIWFCFGDGGG